MPITQPGDAPPRHKRVRVPLILFALIFAGLATPLLVARYHHGLIEKNQNAVIDALREYAALQNQMFVKSGHYASNLSELGGEWAKVAELSAAEPTEFRGYSFKTFSARGAGADGGAKNFLDSRGLMTGGFALMAVPARYGFSGQYAFFISSTNDNKIYFHDLGVKTDTGARMIAEYYVPPGAHVFGEKN